MSVKSRTARKRRQKSVRLKVTGTPERPRLNIFRSLHHIYAQVIDDSTGRTLASASTVDNEVAAMIAGKKKKEQATIVGKVVAERAKSAGLSLVVFDRGGYLYHGRVKALADGAREGGLEF
jgi:large subunit ribosomal protein L18